MVTGSTEEEELKFLESRMEFGDFTCRSIEIEVLEKETKTERSCGLKTKNLCVVAGTPLEYEQASEFVERIRH